MWGEIAIAQGKDYFSQAMKICIARAFLMLDLLLHTVQIRTIARVLNLFLSHKRNPLVSLQPLSSASQGGPSVAVVDLRTCAFHFLWQSRGIPQHPIVKFTRGEVQCIKVP